MVCCASVRRSYPGNFICLGVFVSSKVFISADWHKVDDDTCTCSLLSATYISPFQNGLWTQLKHQYVNMEPYTGALCMSLVRVYARRRWRSRTWRARSRHSTAPAACSSPLASRRSSVSPSRSLPCRPRYVRAVAAAASASEGLYPSFVADWLVAALVWVKIDCWQNCLQL